MERMKRICAIIFIFILLIIFSPGAWNSVSYGSGTPTYMTADKIDYYKRKNLIIAIGNVEIQHKDRIIMGDFLRLDNTTGDGLITGNVIIVDAEDYILCRRAVFNLKTKKGIIYDGSGIIASNYYFNGKEIERIAEDRYRILDGDLTTCCDEIPPWKISLKEADIHLENYAYISHPSFKIKNIPVFYLPYFIFPVKTGRQTGFLSPGIGGGGREGLTVTNNFFWAISESQDATLSWERKDLRGDRLDLEYRYILSRKVSGTLKGAYFEDRDPETRQETNFWKVIYDHNQLFPFNVQGVIHVDQMSESNIDREFEYQDIKTRSRRQTDSHIRLTKNWTTRNLQFLARRRDSTETTYYERYDELPELSFTNQSERIYSTPLYFSFESSLKGFRRENESDSLPKDKIEVNRTDLFPKLSLPVSFSPWFSFTPSGSWRETYYSNGKKNKGFYREFYKLGLSTSGPKFYRIFKSDAFAVKHLVEPAITYSHISKIDKDIKNQIIAEFDYIDKLGSVGEPGNIITYSLTNRFLKKQGNASANEVARLSLSQNYNIQESKRQELDGAPRRPFSDLQITLETQIIPSLMFNYYNSYNVYDKIPFSETLELDINFRGRGYLALERRLKRGVENKRVKYDPVSITNIGSVGINLFNKLKFEMGKLYDELNHVVIESDYAITYTSECWEISYGLINRQWNTADTINENRYETKFFITVTLKNVATIGEKQSLGFIKRRF